MFVFRFAVRGGGIQIIVTVTVVLSTPTWLAGPAFLRDSEDDGFYDMRH